MSRVRMDERANDAVSNFIKAMGHIWDDMIAIEDAILDPSRIDDETVHKMLLLNRSLGFMEDFMMDGRTTILNTFEGTKHLPRYKMIFEFLDQYEKNVGKDETVYYYPEIVEGKDGKQ